LGISGWARNLSDGRVEVLACGEAKAVESLCAWLHKGPAAAEVSSVQCCKVDNSQSLEGFGIG